jgi:hypothetical protein
MWEDKEIDGEAWLPDSHLKWKHLRRKKKSYLTLNAIIKL